MGSGAGLQDRLRRDGVRLLVKYRPELDGLRGVAVMLVFLSHVGLVRQAGTVGVTMFFVLSGYLITTLLLNERETTGRVGLRAFYERRVRRLTPALIACLALTALLAVVSGRIVEYPAQMVAALAYSANLYGASGHDLGLLAHTWSLSLEEQFYLVWPVLFIVLRRPTIVLGLAFVASVLAMFWIGAQTDATLARPDVRANAIIAGCLLALRPMKIRWLGIVAIPAALGGNAPTSLVLAAAVVASVSLVSAPPRWLRHPFLVRIGKLSYGLYLYHFGLTLLARNEAEMALAVVAAIILALVSERWIERPWRLRRDVVERDGRPNLVEVARRAGLGPENVEFQLG